MSAFEVEIVFALPDRQALRVVSVMPGDTLADAVSKSDLRDAFPEYDIDHLTWGIWGHEAPSNQALKDGDRIEIYRPLMLDPREARRQLALSGRTMGGAEPD